MQVFEEVKKLRAWNRTLGAKTVGYVPTMGALHAGHMSLVKKAKQENDLVVVSIFVNPKQFGPNEDLAKYPRPIEKDKELLIANGVDVLFLPTVEEVYPKDFSTIVDVSGLNDVLCGASRPGHFRGVCTVVARLLGLVEPRRTYLGEKDLQQFVILQKMVNDLSMPYELVSCPIIRDTDGLALSSRNIYLSPEERLKARSLPVALDQAIDRFNQGRFDRSSQIEDWVKIELQKQGPTVKVDYVEVRRIPDLQRINSLEGEWALFAAIYVGSTRLIDNRRVYISDSHLDNKNVKKIQIHSS